MNLLTCAPNFSEGRDQRVIQAIVGAVSNVAGVCLLNVDSSSDANRTVVTFAGEAKAVGEAAFQATWRAATFIDMAQHGGLHPRMGALDVCPFVPLQGTPMSECVELAHQVGERIAEELGMPVYYYGEAATSAERRRLENIRRGEYEGLEAKLADPAWNPDAGPARFNPRLGAAAVGARRTLVAFNVNLGARDQGVAQAIALAVRESGYVQRSAQGKPVRNESGEVVREAGTLKACRAIGWYLPSSEIAQVSMNLDDWEVTPPHEAFEEVRKQAGMRNVRVTGSELVGMIPLEPMLLAGHYYAASMESAEADSEEQLVGAAAQAMGLSSLKPFVGSQHILEQRLTHEGGIWAEWVKDLTTPRWSKTTVFNITGY